MDSHQENGDTHRDNGAKKQRLTPLISDDEIRDEFSHHSKQISRINNGSFGCCPKSIIKAQQGWQLRFLEQPDDFYFNTLKTSILNSRTLIQSLVNADHIDEISLVDNATTAAAIVLQHFAWKFNEGIYGKGDVILMLHYAYGAVKKSVEAYVSRAGGLVIEVELPFPVNSNDEIVSAFRKALMRGKESGSRVRLAVIDHITSMPCVLIPIKELVKICREEGVEQVFVDAAHAMGCTNVDMKEIGADFYTSNLHKWFFCPPSVAFLYSKRSSCELHHPVVSHEYGNGLATESAWIGNRDYSPQLVVPSVLQFTNRFEGGIEGIMKRNHEAVVEMGKMLAEAWDTHLGCPPEMCTSMIMVGLPACLGISSDSDTLKLRKHLRENFRVEVPIYFRPPKDGEVGCITGYARISYQVYNRVEDYHVFRDAIDKLVVDGVTCELLSN